MGGWTVLAAASAMPDGYKSMVLEGSSTGKPFAAEGSATWPRNLMLVFAQYEEFSELMWGVERARHPPVRGADHLPRPLAGSRQEAHLARRRRRAVDPDTRTAAPGPRRYCGKRLTFETEGWVSPAGPAPNTRSTLPVMARR